MPIDQLERRQRGIVQQLTELSADPPCSRNGFDSSGWAGPDY